MYRHDKKSNPALVIVDDCSTENMPPIKFSTPSTCDIITHTKNTGVKGALLAGIEKAFEHGATLIINLDSDAIVKPDFVERLVKLHKDEQLICGGFNVNREKILHDGGHYVIKPAINGINMCFNKAQYETYIKPALLSNGNWDASVSKAAQRFAIATPSCVQHIGLQSSMGHVGADVATDFKQLSLPDVTLFGIDSHDIAGIKRAAEISQRDIEFGAIKIITKDLFTKGGDRETRRTDYSRFMIKELTKHFTTSHVLTIHADGYVLDWSAWNDDWLQYDYIGASWWYKDGKNVGNGGFSLRSKKLCDLLAESDLQGEHYHPEDSAICRIYRPALETMGIKFAPAEVADRFSIEAYNVPPPDNKYIGSFGFHGTHVDLSMLPPDLQYRPQIRDTRNHRPVKLNRR
jgi:glycosyltransferase involved in cell wall biosynthesis